MVGYGDTAHHTSAVGVVLADRIVRTSADETGSERLSAPGGLVPQERSDLRRCTRHGAKGAVGPRGADFLRVAFSDRHDKSPAGLHGTANRCGLLCGIMAKVERRETVRKGARATLSPWIREV